MASSTDDSRPPTPQTVGVDDLIVFQHWVDEYRRRVLLAGGICEVAADDLADCEVRVDRPTYRHEVRDERLPSAADTLYSGTTVRTARSDIVSLP